MPKLYVLESCSECPDCMMVHDRGWTKGIKHSCARAWDNANNTYKEIPIDIIIEEDRFPEWCPLENTKLKGE